MCRPVASLGVLQKALGSCHGAALVAVTIVTFLRERRHVDETDHTSLRTRFTLRTPDAPADRSESGRCCTEKPASFTCSLCRVALGRSLFLYLICFYFIWVFLNREIGASDWLLKEKCLFSILFFPSVTPLSILAFPTVGSLPLSFLS